MEFTLSPPQKLPLGIPIKIQSTSDNSNLQGESKMVPSYREIEKNSWKYCIVNILITEEMSSEN